MGATVSETPDKGGGWFKVPNWLVDEAMADLTGGEVKALLAILRNAKEGKAAVGMEYIAERSGTTETGARLARNGVLKKTPIKLRKGRGGRGVRSVYQTETPNSSYPKAQLPQTPVSPNSRFVNPQLELPPIKDSLTKTPKGAASEAEKHLAGSVLDTERFRAAWADWCRYRAEARKKLTPSTMKIQLAKLTRMGEAAAVASIEQSIEQGWAGLFAPKDNSRPSNPDSAARSLADVYQSIRDGRITHAVVDGNEIDLTTTTGYSESGIRNNGQVILHNRDLQRATLR